jgi:uncharacterized protein
VSSERLGWAVVTGASSGIGRALARELAQRGYRVLAVARRRDRLEALAREMGAQRRLVEPLVADLKTTDGLASVARRIAELGSIDILINNAGIVTAGDFAGAALDEELGSIRLNVDAVVTLTRAVLPVMVRARRGAIVNVASVVAFQPFPHFAVYAATKAFVLSFTEAVAEELRGSGIHVLALCPGAARTEIEAQSIVHPFSLAHAYRFAAAFHHFRRERDAVHEAAEASFALSTEHGFAAVLMAADFHRGWLLVDQGEEEKGVASMRAWVKTCRDIRSECLIPTYLAWLAETYGTIGRPREGLDLVGEALAAATESGNHYWTPKLYRLRGTLTDTEKDAESALLEAIAIAQRQRAKSFELRAAMGVSRLWARQGKTRDAHALLAELYAWFTEGFDTTDLQDARALLDELEERRSAPKSTRKHPRRLA